MNNSKEIRALFTRYVRNEVTPEELDRVNSYLKTKEGEACMEEVMEEIADKEFYHGDKVDPTISKEIYGKLQASISTLDKSKPVKSGRVFYLNQMIKVAAVFIGLLVLSAICYTIYNDYQKIVYTTASGQKEKIVLPDLSTVTLNGNSSISYYKGWNNAEKREVYLSGEAFFDVEKNEAKPFIVHTSTLKIKVLGTSFNVKSYKEDELVETTLVEGKVAIENAMNSDPVAKDVVLSPNQKATFSKISEEIILTEVEAETDTSWKKGILIFEDEPFGEIVKDLERWYGVKIILSEEISKECRFRVKIEEESIKEVLDLFKSTTDLTYTIDGNKITLKGTLCNKTN